MSLDLLATIDIIALLISGISNTFILVSNALDWVKTKAINTSDQLICGISFFSSSYEVLKLCGYIVQLPPLNLVVTHDVQRVSMVLCLVIISSNIWISTWLSVSFCFKIVKTQDRFYTYLQRRFPKMITWLLPSSLLVSIFLSLTFAWDVSERHWLNATLNTSRNNTSVTCLCLYDAFIAFSSSGFLLSLTSLVTIIKSLYRHMKQMQTSGENFRNPSLDIHIRAIKTISLLLVINVFFNYALALTTFKGNDSQWTRYIYIFTSICYALNSFNIILGNSKLKGRFFTSFGFKKSAASG